MKAVGGIIGPAVGAICRGDEVGKPAVQLYRLIYKPDVAGPVKAVIAITPAAMDTLGAEHIPEGWYLEVSDVMRGNEKILDLQKREWLEEPVAAGASDDESVRLVIVED